MPAPRRRRQTPRRIIPEKWANLLEKHGFVDTRNGKASVRALSEYTNIHPTTISRVIFQESDAPSINTIYGLAEAFHMTPVELASFAGGSWEKLPPWEPPLEARELTFPQRTLMSDLIKELTRANRIYEQELDRGKRFFKVYEEDEEEDHDDDVDQEQEREQGEGI